ncbi:MAG TPA: coproporphyrinogen-III oxidase family protein [Candidatus Dormibacteraeota bacterium]|nr:coproporphyrinogen-III oxidase family protein [Candidatus Dormibacteraeota bacterium]
MNAATAPATLPANGEAAAPAIPTLPAPPSGLYVHVPFCVSHCPYCDFVVVAGREARGPVNRIGQFLEALEVELELRADALDDRRGRPGHGDRRPLDTLYLGGGTPSLVPGPRIAHLVELVRRRYGLAPDAEVTLEVNPGPDERGDARAMRDAGVTRLSIGAQSMDVGELRRLGRRHTPEDVATTVAEARAAGIASISLDLLYDLPGATLKRWARTLEVALALEPDHVSLYALTLDDPDLEGITGPAGDHLPTPPGARRWRDRARLDQDDDRAAAMYELADRRVATAGLAWYEISNWAQPGHRSRHNLGYWQGASWEAVGPGAHAFDGVTRRWNAARLDAYIAALTPADGDVPMPPPGGRDLAPALQRGAEASILALRTRFGLPAKALDDPEIGAALRWGVGMDLLEQTAEDRLVLTLRGRLVSNELFIRLV